MKIMLDKGYGIMPTRAHPYDAGLDLYAPYDVTVPAARCRCCGYDGVYEGYVDVGTVTIDTGVHVQIPECCVGLIKSRSGTMVRSKLTAEGVIDTGYTGAIRVCLFNHSRTDYKVKAGDKIAQLVIVPCVLLPLEEVESLEKTARGNGGFGSTGR